MTPARGKPNSRAARMALARERMPGGEGAAGEEAVMSHLLEQGVGLS
jgi:hypothetical protein